MDTLRIGDKFHVQETFDVRDKDGQVVTRYQPGFTYDVTPRNLHVLQEAQTANKVVAGFTPGENGAAIQMNAPRSAGSVTTKEK